MFITKLRDLSSPINNSEDRKLTKTKLHCIVPARELYTKYTFARKMDQFRFLGNCPPTPPLSHHFALSETEVLMLA